MSQRVRRGVRLPRVYKPAGRANWYVRMRWEGREVTRLAGATESQANRKAARAYAMRVEGASLDEVLVEVFGDPGGDTMTFEELAAAYLEQVMQSKSKKPSTIRGDIYRLRSLRKASWAKGPVRAVRPRDVTRWAGERARQVRPATLNRDLSMASAVFAWGVANGFVEENPFRGVKRGSERGNARHLYLSAEQVHDLLAAASADLGPLLLCAVSTGMRRGEMLALCWDDVDFKVGTLRVRSEVAKSSKERRVHMTEDLHATLSTLRQSRKVLEMKRGGGRVFLCADGKAMTETRLRKRWMKALDAWEKAPEDLRFHDLRHTAASLMVNAGQDLYVVGNVLGHSSAETTRRYAHLVMDRQRQAVNALGASLRAPESEAG